ncbi:hypothetical protein ACLE20_03665 [Rhizobium sp. YIM 134829]|uniref:hypothetical protein n=1 Tax=Rhizobium sp. YIM 134829 TaxID=3390453 RepID=UPI00397AD923
MMWTERAVSRFWEGARLDRQQPRRCARAAARGGISMAVHLMKMLLNIIAAFTLVSIVALVMIV